MANLARAREFAMQVLFLWDNNGASDPLLAAQVGTDDSALDDETRRIGMEMVSQAWNSRETIDAWIERLAPNWPPRRQPHVDRSIIRLAMWELSNTQTPPKVVIDQAIELAKNYSTDQSPAFVNGVLDAAHKEIQSLKSQ
jgi:N utilization substance protein B